MWEALLGPGGAPLEGEGEGPYLEGRKLNKGLDISFIGPFTGGFWPVFYASLIVLACTATTATSSCSPGCCNAVGSSPALAPANENAAERSLPFPGDISYERSQVTRGSYDTKRSGDTTSAKQNQK
ncbi:unnamed protein product [Cyprideis torosa]|uniref:Uncharacterized protein n=1 Tax=Cyprideis torosa TaxID=163714 RepID=A0A7R8ZYL9_9CRUS|nr:unnamed protein product [Cyprideis torosa]CAG0908571.1 unnamed protein product [Cyprideis torosa]